MKYLILSDIHGSETTTRQGLAWFKSWNCDGILLLGDVLNYGPRNPLPEGLNPLKVAELLNSYADRITAIRGNCDSEVDQTLFDFPCMADYAQITEEGKRIFLSHGHLYHPAHLPKGHFDLYLFGHTHVWTLQQTASGTICNAGSLTLPKEGNPRTFACYDNGQIGVYTLDEGYPLQTIRL